MPHIRRSVTRSLACSLWLALALAAVSVPEALSVDAAGVKVADRWSVVGVIAAGGGKSVAVLRHNPTQKTFTLSIGDALPSEVGFVLKAVHGRFVTVARGPDQVLLAFADASSEEAGEPPSRTTRFLDAYYRGLHDTQDDLTFDPDVAPVDSGATTRLRRFPSFEDARSRFELYRDGRAYRLSDADADAAGGLAVNYDNFDDEPGVDEPDEPTGVPTFTGRPALPFSMRRGAKAVGSAGAGTGAGTSVEEGRVDAGDDGLDASTPSE